MDIYRQLDDAYHHLAARRRRPRWLAAIFDGNLDTIVATIRADRPDSARSDTALRDLIELGRSEPDAMTVAIYALAPRVRARLSRAVTDDYRADVLADLACVLAEGPIDGPRLAGRLVNRAHNRSHKAARRVHTRGVVNIVEIAPHDPERLDRRRDVSDDVAAIVAQRVDLARFEHAVQAAIAAGRLSEASWGAYRDHKLRRAVDPDAPICTNHQRTTASRAVPKLQPLIATYLHAA